MVPIHVQSVRLMSGAWLAGNTAATSADFISRARNTAGNFGNTAKLAWLS
ncbi:hypothetical protein ACVWZ8_001639 [Arthrobacter sp. UYCu723]